MAKEPNPITSRREEEEARAAERMLTQPTPTQAEADAAARAARGLAEPKASDPVVEQRRREEAEAAARMMSSQPTPTQAENDEAVKSVRQTVLRGTNQPLDTTMPEVKAEQDRREEERRASEAEAERRMRSRPTPTQAENDAAALGQHVDHKAEHLVRDSVAQPQSGGGYDTRAMESNRSQPRTSPTPRR